MYDWIIGEWMGTLDTENSEGKFKFSRYLKIDGYAPQSKITLKHHSRMEYWIKGPKFCLSDSVITWNGVVLKTSPSGIRTKFNFHKSDIRIDSCSNLINRDIRKLIEDEIVVITENTAISMRERNDVKLKRFVRSENEEFDYFDSNSNYGSYDNVVDEMNLFKYDFTSN